MMQKQRKKIKETLIDFERERQRERTMMTEMEAGNERERKSD